MGPNKHNRLLAILCGFVLISLAVPALAQNELARTDRQLYETVMFDKFGNRNTDVVYRVKLKKVEDELVFDFADYLGTEYVLTDNFRVVRDRGTPREIFVSQIFEHRHANKTVVIIPALYSDVDRAFDKFLVLKNLVSSNPRKIFTVLLENIDRQSATLEEFHAIRGQMPTMDYYQVVTEPYAYHLGLDRSRAAISPSMALFYSDDAVKLEGLITTEIIDRYVTDEIERRSVDIEAGLQEVFDDLNDLHDEFFDSLVASLSLKLQFAISRSMSKPENDVLPIITRVNDLQRRLAAFMVRPDFGASVVSGMDVEADVILNTIDRLCGAGSVDIYNEFRSTAKSAGFVLTDVGAKLYSTTKLASVDVSGIRAMELARARLISDAFSEIGENEVAVCELSADLVDDQILEGLRRAEYNLVIFNTPYHEPNIEAIRHAQSPEEHQALWPPENVNEEFSDVYLPVDSKRLFETDPQAFNKLIGAYRIFQNAYREGDRGLGAESVLIHHFAVGELGALLRVSARKGEAITEDYYFMPGSDLEEQAMSFRLTYGTEEIPTFARLVLDKWAQVTKASFGL